MREWLVIILICLLSFILLNFRLVEVPPGINQDEASIGHNAILLSKTLHDENGRLLPLFILTLNKTDWKQPVTVYSTAVFFKIFGPSFHLLRQVSIFFVILSIILLYLLAKDLFGIKGAITTVVIFLTIPSVMIQSHLGLENIAPVPFVIFWLWMLYRFQKTESNQYLVLSAVSLGISFYSYNGMRLIMPVLALISLLYIYYLQKKHGIRSMTFFLVGIMPFLLIIPWAQQHYAGAIYSANRVAQINNYQDFFLPYLSAFDLSFLFLTGDITPYHSTGRQGVFLLASLPLFILGIFHALKKKNSFLIFILISFLVSPLFFGFAGSIHRGSRILAILPMFSIICTVGMLYLFGIRKTIHKVLMILISILLVFNYGDFLQDYWYHYSNRVTGVDFIYYSDKAYEKLFQESQKRNLTPLIDKQIAGREKIAGQFFEDIYFPNGITKWENGQAVPNHTILLSGTIDEKTMDDIGLEKIDQVKIYSLSVKDES